LLLRRLTHSPETACVFLTTLREADDDPNTINPQVPPKDGYPIGSAVWLFLCCEQTNKLAGNDTKNPPHMMLGEAVSLRLIIEAMTATIGSITHNVAVSIAPMSRLLVIISLIGMTPEMMARIIAQLHAVKSVGN